MPHQLTNPTCPAGHTAASLVTKIHLKFAPDSPVVVRVKRIAKNPASIIWEPKNLTLFQIAAQMDIPGRPRMTGAGPVVTAGDFAGLRTEAVAQNTARNTARRGKKSKVMAPNISIERQVEDAPTAIKDRDSRPELRTVEFRLAAPGAGSVKIAADFTGWEKCPLDLNKDENGIWLAAIPLPPGQYSYRFIVDGQWCADPRSGQRTPNPCGLVDSVVAVA